MERIILDANVLYSNSLRGLFLWMSWRKLCEIIWSPLIWDEVFRNYSNDPQKEREFRKKVLQNIFSEFPHSMRPLNSGYPLVGLTDKSDEHVVALARQENVGKIVTFNLKDFPKSILSGLNIESLDPDSLLCDWLGKYTDGVKAALQENIVYLKKSKPTKAAYFGSLRKCGLNQFTTLLEAEDDAGNLFEEVWV